MHMNTSTRIAAAALTAALASAGGGAAAASAPSTPQPAAGAGCVDLSTLTEVQYAAVADVSHGPLPAVGDTSTYDDVIYDTSVHTVGTTLAINRREIARVHGRLAATSANAQGHVELAITERIVFPDGAVEASGNVDAAAMFGGTWLDLHARGLTGRYRGMTGTRSFQLVQPVPTVLVNAKFDLCRER